MSLNKEIEALRDQFNKALPEEALNVIRADNERLAKSGFAERGLKAGDKVTPFSLLSAHGATVTSGDLLATGPVVLSFYRGGW
jgi:hypothetical protein